MPETNTNSKSTVHLWPGSSSQLNIHICSQLANVDRSSSCW